MGPTRSWANYWEKEILDMYLILLEIYWWGDDKSEVRGQQVLNAWQFGIYSYTHPCVWDIFRWIIYLNNYPNILYGEHEAINAAGVYFIHEDIRCFIHYIP